MPKTVFIIIALLPVLLLQACAPVVVGGAAVGASVLHDRRPAKVVLTDEQNELRVYSRIGEEQELAEQTSVGVTSYNAVVLLTGQAQTPRQKARVEEIAAAVPDVKRVVNEIQISNGASLVSESHDVYLTSRVKLALFDLDLPDFDPTRVKVVTEQDVVFLMGLVTPQEADAVVEKVRYVDGVKRVVKVFEYL